MVKEVKETLMKHINETYLNIEANVSRKLKDYEYSTTTKLSQIETVLRAQKNDSNQFEMALKTELEDMASHHRNTSTEHINLIKAVTESIKHLKEHQQSMSDMEVFKDIMPNILLYFH